MTPFLEDFIIYLMGLTFPFYLIKSLFCAYFSDIIWSFQRKSVLLGRYLIERKDYGNITIPASNGHYNLFEFPLCDLSKTFKLEEDKL